MRRHRRFSTAERNEVWALWRKGSSTTDIARLLGRQQPNVRAMINSNGGFPPPMRRRSPEQLSPFEREEISRGLCQKLSIRAIALRIDRAPSTVSREVARNGGGKRYRAAAADERAWEEAKRPKQCKLAHSPQLRRLVAEKLGC